MKLTLLQVVQRTLSAMNADNVNSISDTYESEAIARVAEEVYYELIAKADWPQLKSIIKLYSAPSTSERTTLVIPENVKHIKALWYKDKELKYVEPEDFIRMAKNTIATVDTVTVTLPDGTDINVASNKDPEYFTIFNNKLVVANSLDTDDGYTLLSGYTSATCSITPGFDYRDDFVPEMEESFFPTYLSMVRRAAFVFFRREASMHDERVAIAGMGRLLRDKNRLIDKQTRPHYGRR